MDASDCGWTLEDAKNHFFIYVERTGAADLLHELRVSQLAANRELLQIASNLLANLESVALATSAPFYTAMLGAHAGRAASVQKLIELAASTQDRHVVRSAVAILDDSGAFIDETFSTLRLVHERGVMPGAFQALLQQGTSMVWAAFESFCSDVFRLLFTTDRTFLRAVAAAHAPGTPWAEKPKKLLAWIDAETMNPAVTAGQAFDAFVGLPSMQLRAARHFTRVVFPTAATLLSLIGSPELSKLSARRHLFMHAAGVVDQDYMTDSGDLLPLGSKVIATPRDLALGFRAVSSAAGALVKAVDGVV